MNVIVEIWHNEDGIIEILKRKDIVEFIKLAHYFEKKRNVGLIPARYSYFCFVVRTEWGWCGDIYTQGTYCDCTYRAIVPCIINTECRHFNIHGILKIV